MLYIFSVIHFFFNFENHWCWAIKLVKLTMYVNILQMILVKGIRKHYIMANSCASLNTSFIIKVTRIIVMNKLPQKLLLHELFNYVVTARWISYFKL